MPPSSRRPRPRKAAEVQEVSDAGTPESIATPSRTSRKRARGNDTVAPASRASTRRKIRDTRTTEREDTEGTEAQELSDAETEPAVPTELDVISKLKVADKLVHASQDFSNNLLEGKENVPGYGKIAGRDWTYIIRGVEINIGRPEQHEKAEAPDAVSSQATENAQSAKSKIEIDLGPDRQISRLHAVINYESETEQWYISVNGRNGLRVDTQLLKRGNRAILRSGNVIDICGTQMAFITTARHENDGPVFADAIIRQTYTSEEEEGDGDSRWPAPGPSHSHPSLPAPSSSVRRPAHPSSSFNDSGANGHRVHPHSSQAGLQASTFQVPGTPIRNQGMQIPTSRTRPSPVSVGGYARGVMIESTESIDYAADSAKDLKPPHSYAQLIGMAILSTSEQQMTLNNIYKWIMGNYAFYRFNTGGWQNSIRHNLSLNKAFEKIARRTDEPGKGMKWMISPKERETFLSQGMKGCRRPNPLPSNGTRAASGSNPSSPAQLSAQAHAKLNGAVNGVPGKVEQSASPPMYQYPSYPTAQEAYTPDRGSRRAGNTIKFDDNDPELIYPPSAKSTLNHLTAAANAAGSPPSLYVNEDGRIGQLDTPFPVRSSQKLAPPSTLQRPSAFMEFSSPAPFWKFGSTPLRPIADISPLKTPFSAFRPLGADVKIQAEDDKDAIEKKSDSEEKDDDMLGVQSSSPPRPNSAGYPMDASPTRSIPRPATSNSRSAKLEQSTQSPEAGGSNANMSFERFADAEITSAPVRAEAGPTNAVDRSLSQSAGPPPNAMRPPMQTMGSNYTTSGGQQNGMTNGHGYAPNGSMTGGGHGHNIGSLRYAADADEDAGIDLAKGFQPIGTFHKMGAARFGMGMAGR
ncbi:hypothetical protein MBLNU459_g6514t1 [Dothideomycetes sp. NU459]